MALPTFQLLKNLFKLSFKLCNPFSFDCRSEMFRSLRIIYEGYT